MDFDRQLESSLLLNTSSFVVGIISDLKVTPPVLFICCKENEFRSPGSMEVDEYLGSINYKASYIYRERNAVAYKLASKGIHLTDEHWWLQYLDFCSSKMHRNLQVF